LGHELDNYVLGESRDSTLNCEEKLIEGIKNWIFLGLWAGVHVGGLGRGTDAVFLLSVLGNFSFAGADLLINGVTMKGGLWSKIHEGTDWGEMHKRWAMI
jgi:hypothetical protein